MASGAEVKANAASGCIPPFMIEAFVLAIAAAYASKVASNDALRSADDLNTRASSLADEVKPMSMVPSDLWR
jgi:hypothetical protein